MPLFVQVDTLKFERDTGVQADTLTQSAASMPDSGVSMTSSSAAVHGLSPASTSTDALRGFTPSSDRAASAASSTNLMRKGDDYDVEGDAEEDIDEDDVEHREGLLEKFAAEYVEEEKREERKRRRRRMESIDTTTATSNLNLEEEISVEEQLDKLLGVLRGNLDELHRLLEEEKSQDEALPSQDLVRTILMLGSK